ncbi:hypothetical protein VIBHAR_04826 [Vibrio campbellii ATCC BAA-1116]|uniref:Uncharacterized protein n=1 Tax=Vibrio campbellii (strain ATCC BAA-1116) TaxID=2902295 RepID=A7N5R4_VIBC1|nr:hypothetical protein VIBHAR_04826 [Vibrio campbellii ATCC BAA-1116]
MTLHECEYSHYRAAHLTNCVLFLSLLHGRLCDKKQRDVKKQGGTSKWNIAIDD